MADRNSCIGVFDSGVGGMTVLRAMREQLPNESFLYLGDTARMPYGTKSVETVRRYALEAAAALKARGIKLLVIACNTATAAAIEDLRRAYPDLIVIGIEPALKPAHEMRRSGSILVLATPMTLKLEKFRALYERYGEGAIPLPCPGLMELVEREAFDEAESYLRELFLPYDMHSVDAVVLGCTHYVFLRPLLAKLLPAHVLVLDGNLGTARQLDRVLRERGLRREGGEGSVTLRTSGDEATVIPLMQRLLRGV